MRDVASDSILTFKFAGRPGPPVLLDRERAELVAASEVNELSAIDISVA